MIAGQKYRNKKTVVDGISFSSKKEAGRYSELKILERAGSISALRLQPRFKLIVNGTLVCTYVADFIYLDNDSGQEIVEDSKGFRTREYKIKKKLMKSVYGISVLET